MKTYIIYSAEGTSIATVKGSRMVVGDKAVIIHRADFIVAIIPFEGKYAVVVSPDVPK